MAPRGVGRRAGATANDEVALRDPGLAAIAERLAAVHKDIRLPLADRVRLTTWVDSNGQYYGSYYGRRNLKYKDHPNFRPLPTFTSATGIRSIEREEDR